MSTCKSCGAKIIWARTAGDRRMPVEHYGPGGNIHLADDPDGGMPVATVDRHGQYMSHFVTCPNAKEHRR
jgi:hypothetical protein